MERKKMVKVVWWPLAWEQKGRRRALRTALAMGADEAVLINTSSVPKALNPVFAAESIATYIKDKGVQIGAVFAGKASIDMGRCCFAQNLARRLELACVNDVCGFSERKVDSVRLEREMDGGVKHVIEVGLPAVFTTSKGLNTPRYVSLPGIMKAKKKPLEDVAYSEELFARFVDTFSSPVRYMPHKERPPVSFLEGEPGEQANHSLCHG